MITVTIKTTDGYETREFTSRKMAARYVRELYRIGKLVGYEVSPKSPFPLMSNSK